MTFVQIQDRVMTRLNLTSTSARARIKDEINDRYRMVQTSLGLARTRRGSKNFTTASGNSTTTVASGIAKVFTVYDPTNLKQILTETTLPAIRQRDPASAVKGFPREYAVKLHTNDAIVLQLFPQPQAAGTLVADCLLSGTDMSVDGDSPAFPTDFHDILVIGVMADELDHVEKTRPLADKFETRFEKRLAELRYFIAKSSYLVTKQSDHDPLGHRKTTTNTIA